MTEKWITRYLSLAQEVSTWSKDPSTKIGAVAVGDNGQILSQGYNGFPRGVDDCEERLNDKETKYDFIVHGEMNCIYNACLNGVSLKGSTVYVHGLPVCSNCCNGLIQVGVAAVVMGHPSTIDDRWEESFAKTKVKLIEAKLDFIRYEYFFDKASNGAMKLLDGYVHNKADVNWTCDRVVAYGKWQRKDYIDYYNKTY